MAYARVGASQATTGSPVNTTGLSLTRTAGAVGNLLIVGGITAAVGSVIACSDTQGNTWIEANPDFNDGTNATRMRSFYAIAINTSSTTVTIKNTDSGSGFWAMTLEEFSGNDPTPLDQVAHSVAGASGTPTSPSITPTVNDELIWTVAADSVTAVGNIDGSAATKGGDDGVGDWSEFRVLTGRAGISMTAAFTGSGAYDLLVASFKPPQGPLPSVAIKPSYLDFPKFVLRQ